MAYLENDRANAIWMAEFYGRGKQASYWWREARRIHKSIARGKSQ